MKIINILDHSICIVIISIGVIVIDFVRQVTPTLQTLPILMFGVTYCLIGVLFFTLFRKLDRLEDSLDKP